MQRLAILMKPDGRFLATRATEASICTLRLEGPMTVGPCLHGVNQVPTSGASGWVTILVRTVCVTCSVLFLTPSVVLLE